MKLQLVFLIVVSLSISHGRVVENTKAKSAKATIKKPTILRQDVEEYNDNENAVDGNISTSNIIDGSDGNEVTSSESIVNGEANLENNEVLQEINQVPQEVVSEASIVNTDDTNLINRYCKCTTYECNCCRDFSLPFFPIKGPGCATIQYLDGNRMSVGIKFADRVLANRVISGRKTTPVCIPLPGGFNRFCGRVYGIGRRADDFFKACLGLELRADNEVEAVLRVSCFKFGPRGLTMTDAEPLPPVDDIDIGDDDDDDDDDDDEADELIGSFDLEDEDDDDDDDDDDDVEQDESEAQSSDPGYTGFSLLEGDILDDLLGSSDKKKINKTRSSTTQNGKTGSDKTMLKKYVPIVMTSAKKNNSTLTASKKKDISDEITEFVESIVSDDDDDDGSAESDDDTNNEKHDTLNKQANKPEGANEDNEEDDDDNEYDESDEGNETNNEEESSDAKISKQPKSGFSWSNLTRLFRIF
ncbi:uncharacterized protein LOC129763253 isoform X2 [Toxorhynchites rutilus septentrionalis]|uniref:uncharacterized protein LOC129763253 isoform X2 n=1 Tax=Toxorhynchites rutilus septentrionalis TaxID=329112 RepID=UPI00247AC87B|nr:uncharacterized protein LOC129763253 isoform X2 [Toxorhynchites rutilus septentrionalis]